ncbi:MAG: hypothetical protein EXS46_03205 [Candidatus Taylorbacteria bacterium]|nr:hypothetical protein [Candidatus Taylorbacteria bacterium]
MIGQDQTLFKTQTRKKTTDNPDALYNGQWPNSRFIHNSNQAQLTVPNDFEYAVSKINPPNMKAKLLPIHPRRPHRLIYICFQSKLAKIPRSPLTSAQNLNSFPEVENHKSENFDSGYEYSDKTETHKHRSPQKLENAFAVWTKFHEYAQHLKDGGRKNRDQQNSGKVEMQ